MLTLDTVRAGLDALRRQLIHEQFPAYLHLRQRALSEGSFDDIEPVWREVGDLLRVPGGPPTKPHYRPFSSRNVREPGGYWFNRNLAGSYAPSSVRSTSRFMLNAAGDGFALPPDHAQRAYEVLLFETRVPAWALAAYYLRNYGFAFEGQGGPDELIQAFRQVFLFASETDGDYEVLFEDDDRPTLNEPWFEPFTPADGEGENQDA